MAGEKQDYFRRSTGYLEGGGIHLRINKTMRRSHIACASSGVPEILDVPDIPGIVSFSTPDLPSLLTY